MLGDVLGPEVPVVAPTELIERVHLESSVTSVM